MKRKYMIPVMASLLAISACDYNEDNFEGFEDLGRPTNVMKINYKLTDADYNEMSSDVKANKYFTSTEEADNNIPGWLAEKYFTADQGSTANITYRMKVQNNQYSDIPYLTLAEEDYNIIHGEGYYAPYLNAGTEGKLYEILKEKMPDATEGTYTFVEYQYSENGVPQQMDAPVWQYNFEDLNLGDLTSLDGWFIQSSGDEWEIKEYSKNKYAQFTANYAEAEAETWLITPAINIEDANKKLSWDVTVGYWKADCLSVYIVEDFDGKDIENAKKTNVTANFTIPQEPTNDYGTMASAGVMSLDGYSGKTIRVAFHYAGNKKEGTTTTYQVDNIVIGNDIPTPVNTELRFALYEKESKGWYKFTNTREAIAIPYGEYTVMGEAADDMSFSSSVKAEDYIPNYLLKNIDYPLNGDTCTVIYRYYAGSGEYEAYSDQYVYNDTVNVWQYTDNIYTETRPYGFDGSQWVYSPSVTIDLPAGKNNAEVSAFYQAITDWVKENYPDYVTSYGNNDYYYGGSAYQNNFDFRVSAWKQQGTYDDLSDEEIESLMWERLPESFPHALEVLYADAAPAENGVPVIYTINFFIYDGSATLPWTIQYQVVSKGQFEYVEDSLQEVK